MMATGTGSPSPVGQRAVRRVAARGIVVYLSHWFRVRDRGRAIALYQIGNPLSGIIGAPLSGLLLGIHWLGLTGWRWVFITEGLPAVVLGVVTFYYITDHPHEAR